MTGPSNGRHLEPVPPSASTAREKVTSFLALVAFVGGCVTAIARHEWEWVGYGTAALFIILATGAL